MNAPAQSQSLANYFVVYADLFGPFHHAKSSATISEQAGIASISRVLQMRCPSHIAWFVIAVIVWKAVQFVFRRWTWANVSKKGLETFWTKPAMADANAAASVSCVVGVSRIQTARLHADPDFVLATVRHPVLFVFSAPFSIQAAAALRAAVHKGGMANRSFSTANAAALAKRLSSTRIVKLSQDCPSTDYFARKIDKMGHDQAPFQLGCRAGRRTNDVRLVLL